MQMAFPICIYGAGVAQRLYKGLPRDGPGFDYRLGRCKDPAARPSQGTVNGGAVSEWPRCWWDAKHNQPTNLTRIILF